MSHLLPEKPLLVLPSLTKAIGLEEATMLSALDELSGSLPAQESRGYHWYTLGEPELRSRLPFLDNLGIQRVSLRLRDLGIVLLLSAPFEESRELKFAFNKQAIERYLSITPNNPAAAQQPQPTQNQTVATPSGSMGATLIAPNWQPDQETFRALAQLSIPEHFVREQTPEFVSYWRERKEAQRSWNAKFIQYVKHQWTHYVAKKQHAIRLASNWQPSGDLLNHIAQEGIPNTFMQKSLQRFRMHHQNSGQTHTNWDMPFFSWVKEDWEKQDTVFLDQKKTPMTLDWQPDKHTLNYLTNSQGIEPSFIEESIPEFIHKWMDKKGIHNAWGDQFARHITEQWRFVKHGIEKNPEPKLIHAQWQPSADCLEILETHSGIERQFIRQQIPEFILYWSNRAQPMHSWDNIFLRHVKHQWKQQYEKQQNNSEPRSTREVSLEERITDTSWAH